MERAANRVRRHGQDEPPVIAARPVSSQEVVEKVVDVVEEKAKVKLRERKERRFACKPRPRAVTDSQAVHAHAEFAGGRSGMRILP